MLSMFFVAVAAEPLPVLFFTSFLSLILCQGFVVFCFSVDLICVCVCMCCRCSLRFHNIFSICGKSRSSLISSSSKPTPRFVQAKLGTMAWGF